MNCADLRGGDERWDAAYGACWDQAKSAVEVTASVRAFCEIYTLAEFDCGYWYAMDACERDFGMWSEGLRNRVTACVTNRTCSVAESCLSALFEGR